MTRAIIGKIPNRLHRSVNRCGRRRGVQGVLFSVVAAAACGSFFANTAAAQTSMSCEVGRVSTIRTLAGTGNQGFSGDGGPATAARLNIPSGVAVDAAGNVYVAEEFNHRIRRIAPDGTIETIAGTGQAGFSGDGGPATDSQLERPTSVAVDAQGRVYIPQRLQGRVRRILTDGTIETFAGTGVRAYGGDGGPATAAHLTSPDSVAVDAAGYVYVTDKGPDVIRRISTDGTIETIAGTGQAGFSGDGGPATAAQFNGPSGVAVDATGNVYVYDDGNGRIRRIGPDGTIETVAEFRVGISDPVGVAVDAAGYVYTAESGNNRVRRIAPDGTIDTVAGTGRSGFSGDSGPAIEAQLDFPKGVAVDSRGNLYIADSNNNRVRVVEYSDDHGDEAECATPLTLGVAMVGRIEVGDDADWFRLELTETTTSLAIYTTGDLVDTVGSLYDESDSLIASDDNGGNGTNFHIEGARPANVYHVRVESAGSETGRYTLHVRRYVDVVLDRTVGETVRLWATAAGGWTRNPATDKPFASSNEVTASNGDVYVLTLGSDGVWVASLSARAAGACLADWTIGTLAGTGMAGYGGDGGPASVAQLDHPLGVAVDAAGVVYVADRDNNRIRRINLDGTIESFAGTGVRGYGGDGGPATAAQLNSPSGVASDGAGYVYFADTWNHRVRRIAPDGTITTIAGTGVRGYGGDGGPATDAQLDVPIGIAVDSAGYVYVADTRNNRIRRIAPDGSIETVAGAGARGNGGDGGPATAAQLDSPAGITVDSAGNVYVADGGNNGIRRIGTDGIIDTVAGTGAEGYGGDGGPATAAQFDGPGSVAVDAAGNIYVSDSGNDRIRLICPTGTVWTIAGTGVPGYGGDDGPATAAQLTVGALAVDAVGIVYFADTGNERVRALLPPAGDDHADRPGRATPLALGVAVDGEIDTGDDSDWFRLELTETTSLAIYTTGSLDTVGSVHDGLGRLIVSNDDRGEAFNFHLEADWPAGTYYIQVQSFRNGTGRYTVHARRLADVKIADTGETVRLWQTAGGGWTLDPATGALFATGTEVTAANGGRYVLTLGRDGTWTASAAAPDFPGAGSCDAVREWTIDTFAGTGEGGYGGDGGPATDARLRWPYDVAVDAAGYVYVADRVNERIRWIAPDGTIDTIAGTGARDYGGDGGPATEAQLNDPYGVAVDAAGYVYVADRFNHRIRRFTPNGTIETIAGTGAADFGGDGGPATAALLNQPSDMAVDASGYVYVADMLNHRIRRIAPNGTIETFAGTGDPGFGGDGGPATEARIDNPGGVAVDSSGFVYVADWGNHRIRRIAPDGTIDTIAGTGDPEFGGDGDAATDAWLNAPVRVAVDASGYVYIADAGNERIRRIAPDGTIETLAGTGTGDFGGDGGPASEAHLHSPWGVAADASGNVYIADVLNNRIRVLRPSGDHGDAPACATVLRLGVPARGQIDPGDDQDWFRLQLGASASVGVYTTGDLDTVGSLYGDSAVFIAGNDDTDDENLNFSIVSDLTAGVYYVRVESYRSETGGYTLRAREFTDVALGNTGETIRLWATDAADDTSGWTLDPSTDDPFTSGGEVAAHTGARYVLTLGSGGVWTASPVVELCEASLAGTIRNLGGTAGTAGYSGDGGFAVDARLYAPFDVAVDAAGAVFVAERGNALIRRIGPDGIITTFAGTGVLGFSGDGGPATAAQFLSPIGVAVDAAGYVYVADRLNHRIRRIGPDGVIETFAGTGTAGDSGDGGPATSAQLDEPTGVAVDAAGNVYVADSQNHRIRRIGLGGTIEAFAGTGSFGHAGDGGPATSARLTWPFDVAVDASGVVYVADTFNHRVRRIGTDGTITTIAGTGTEGYGGDGGEATAAHLNNPSGVAVSGAGYVFVAEFANHRIRRIAPDGTIETFAGTGVSGLGADGGPAIAAQLLQPSGVTVDPQGRVYIADQSSHRVRVVDLAEGCR